MKRRVKFILCMLMVLCMMAGCGSPAGNGVEGDITPTNTPVDAATPSAQPEKELTPTPQPESGATPTPQPEADGSEAPAIEPFVPEVVESGAVTLADKTGAAPIYIDAEGPAFAGLRLIADAIAGDVEAITGIRPSVVNAEPERGIMLIAGLVDEEIITREGLSWEISASEDSFKSEDFERYQIQVKKDGEKTKIIVAGADKRGTIYGMFHITQDLCGVSPWIWWGDAKPAHQDILVLDVAELETTSKRPSVNYRGFFLNDENPAHGRRS